MYAAQKRRSLVKSVPSPYGGLNDSEPLAAMGDKYALVLDNWFAGNLSCSVRSGYRKWATGLGSPVKTLVNYFRVDGTEELFAATDAGLYGVSNSTASPVLVAALTTGVVTFTHFSNVAGNYLVVANGVDPFWLYDGTTWIAATQEATPTTPGQISGVDPSLLDVPLAYKGRLWFIKRDSLEAYYLGTDAVSGAATVFLLGSIFNRGGGLVQLFTWSLDSGEGMDDNLVFQTSAGELAIYTGTDPASVDTWTLQSMYYSSAPIGPRSSDDFGGDVLLLTRQGMLPLSTIIKGNLTVSEEEVALSKRISRQLQFLVNDIGFTPNWELHNVPGQQAVIVVIPATPEKPSLQYVMNSITTAWSRYTIPDINCARIFRNKFYLGDSGGTVYLYGGSRLDAAELDGTGGVPISARLLTAFNYFDDPTMNKHFKLIRPIFQSGSEPAIYTRILVDYGPEEPILPPPIGAGIAGDDKWDSAKWDTATWESSVQSAFHSWRTVFGMGFCAAFNLVITVGAPTQLVAVEWAFENGGAI